MERSSGPTEGDLVGETASKVGLGLRRLEPVAEANHTRKEGTGLVGPALSCRSSAAVLVAKPWLRGGASRDGHFLRVNGYHSHIYSCSVYML